MQASIALTLALTIHGNAHLRGVHVEKFFPTNSTCRFCRKIDFAAPGPVLAFVHRTYASTPDQWFAKLAADYTDRLFVKYFPSTKPRISDRNSVTFVGGGGHWYIVSVAGSQSAAWESRWTLSNKDSESRQIWDVTYRRSQRVSAELPEHPSLDTLAVEITEALRAASAFARERDLSWFVDRFDRAIACLHSDNPRAFGEYSDISPEGLLPREAERILNAVQVAWVFGGMGSWNDISVDEPMQQRYEALADNLYFLLNRAAIVAANTSSQ